MTIGILLAALLIAAGWLIGLGVVGLLKARKQKPDSFITQEMKRLEIKGKNK